jgi:RHS repeat-associated protein
MPIACYDFRKYQQEGYIYRQVSNQSTMNFQNCNPAQRSPALAEGPQVTAGLNDVLGAGQAAAFSDNNTIPKAYINYMFFDRNRQYKRGGFKQVSSAARNAPETLALSFNPEEESYMMIYVANQTNEDLDVHFDDLTVEHLEGPIIRTDDYYPFGLTFNSSARSGYTSNKFLYNGKELQEDLGLDWYDYGARMYDAAIGRWNVVDPLANDPKNISWSPYTYVRNNPINYIDPTGLKDTTFNAETDKRVDVEEGTETPIVSNSA